MNDEKLKLESNFFPDIKEIPKILDYDYLVTNITQFHNHVENCIDSHFTMILETQVPLEEMIVDCTGDKGSHLIEYYNDIKFLMKKFLKDELKQKMTEGICDHSFFECIEYFKAVQLFVELDFDVAVSIQANLRNLEDLIGKEKIEFFKHSLKETIVEYIGVKNKLREQQHLLVTYINLKKT